MRFFFKRSKFRLVSANFWFRAEEKKATRRAESSWKSFSSSCGSSQLGSDSSTCYLSLCHVGCLSLTFLNWDSQQSRTHQTKSSIGPILFLFYEESLVSSNLNSKLFMLHCVRPSLHTYKVYFISVLALVPSESWKNNFLWIGMSFNQEKMSIWNASIWDHWPCMSIT